MNLTINHIPESWKPNCDNAFYNWCLRLHEEQEKQSKQLYKTY